MGDSVTRPATGATSSPTPTGSSAPPAIVALVESFLKEGREREAVVAAYLRAEDDVRRAFGMKLPKQWTHREFLSRYLRPDMGYVAVLLPRLYALFEPARYGDGRETSATGLLPILRSLYQEPALRTLPFLPTAGPPLAPRRRSGGP
ncbi:MAG: hypothetical protein ACREDE_08500 [Thermoplasmata archaeon]